MYIYIYNYIMLFHLCLGVFATFVVCQEVQPCNKMSVAAILSDLSFADSSGVNNSLASTTMETAEA